MTDQFIQGNGRPMASIPELGFFSIYLSPKRSVLPVRLCWPVESMPDQMASNGLSEGIYSPSWARAVTCRCTMHAASNAPYHCMHATLRCKYGEQGQKQVSDGRRQDPSPG